MACPSLEMGSTLVPSIWSLSYGITGNSKSLVRYHWEVGHLWRRWLSRRSRKAKLNWEKMKRLLQRFPLPPPKAIHSFGGR